MILWSPIRVLPVSTAKPAKLTLPPAEAGGVLSIALPITSQVVKPVFTLGISTPFISMNPCLKYTPASPAPSQFGRKPNPLSVLEVFCII